MTAPQPPPFAGAVLTGGASRRMGRDKAFIEVEGQTLVSRAVDALQGAGARPVVVVGGDPAGLEPLGLTHLVDPHPGQGPVQALVGAFAHLADHAAVVVLGCDLLSPHPASIRATVAALAAAPAAVVAVPVVAGRPQWMHACWRRRPALAVLDAGWTRGERSIGGCLDPRSVVEVEGLEPGSLADADEPADLPDPSPHVDRGDGSG